MDAAAVPLTSAQLLVAMQRVKLGASVTCEMVPLSPFSLLSPFSVGILLLCV